jgi:predicted house-cleaning noncanonical NTP pyrophosphatase (MazG superfamily)
MKTIKYNKLIRDYIPRIMDEAGKKYTVSILGDNEFCLKLKEKLLEEGKEVQEADKENIINELADVLEVVEAIESYYGVDHKTVLEKKESKAIKNGKFNKRLLLEEVIEND